MMRSLMLVVLLGVALVWLAASLRTTWNDPTVLPPNDYLEYWSAGRALWQGQNPYDGAVLAPLQRDVLQTSAETSDPVMMWNPPWVLPVAMILGALPWRVGQLVWFIGNLSAILLAARWLWQRYAPQEPPHLALPLALLFFPTVCVLLLGQISAWLLVGLAGFLHSRHRGCHGLAGCFLVLTAIKPHLFSLVVVALLLQAVFDRGTRRSVLSGSLVLLVASVFPLLLSPVVWQQYRESSQLAGTGTHHTIGEWANPTLAYALRMNLPGQPFAAVFVPLAIGVVLCAVYCWQSRVNWQWSSELPRLVLGSVLVAPYGAWAFDCVVLLVPTMQALAWLKSYSTHAFRNGCIGYGMANALAFSSLAYPNSMANPWIVPGVLLGTLMVAWFAKRSSQEVGSPVAVRMLKTEVL